MLSYGVNNIDEFIWEKVSGSLLSMMEYLSEVMISVVRFYPKSLRKLLVMYGFSKNNTDLGYDIDFLNVGFGDGGLSGLRNSNMIEEFREFLMEIAIGICSCAVSLVEAWKSNDWKASVNWIESRNTLLTHLSEFITKFENHISLQKGQGSSH
jgi:hypothetical protein